MSVVAIAWAKAQKAGSPTRKAVLVALADYADEKGCAWPSVARLMSDTELSERAVQGALRELVGVGLLSKSERKGETGVSRSCVYAMPIVKSARGQDVPPRVQVVPPRGQDVRGEGAGGAPPRGQEVPPHYVEPSKIEPPLEPSGEERTRADARLAFPSDAFDRFWKLFPNRVGKQAAEKSFGRVCSAGKVQFADLMAGLERYAAKTDDRPWCNPATWLNQGRWEDVPAVATGPPQQSFRVVSGNPSPVNGASHANGRFSPNRGSITAAIDAIDADDLMRQGASEDLSENPVRRLPFHGRG